MLKRLPGLPIALLLCLFTVWPLLNNPGLPNGLDTLYHVYRAAEMDRSWAAGVLLPRWAESFYFGYGSPLFHYYAGLTYYITSLLIRLGAGDPVMALRLLIVGCMLLASGGVYAFMRARAGRLAAIIAAVVYVYSPYLVYKEPYARGDFPELLALCLFPLVLWRFDALLRGGRGRDLAPAALGGAALVISHNLMALALTGFLLAWVLWEGARRGRAHLLRGLAALALGVGLTAYFWLPVLAERDAVQLENLVALAELDYRNFFVPLPHLLSLVPLLDGGALNGLRSLQNLGIAQWTLALAGLAAAALLARRTLGRDALFFGLMAGALLLLIIPAGDFLWAGPLPLSYFQFPWRFLGPLSLCLAILAGYNAAWVARLPARAGAVAGALLIVYPITTAMPLLYVPEWTNTTVDTSTGGYHAAELAGRQLATTYSSEFLPATVAVIPDPTARLSEAYAAGGPVDRAHREALPPEVTLEPLGHGPQFSAWRVDAPFAFTLEVLTFAFPGWAAEIDGTPVPIYPSAPHGLITFDVPPGTHDIRLYLGPTPARSLGWAVSAVALILLLAGVRLLKPLPLADAEPPAEADSRAVGGALIGAAAQVALFALLMRPGVMWHESAPGTALPAQEQVVYDLGESIQLLGFDLNGRDFRPGDSVELALYWYGRAPIPYGYASFVHISAGGPPVAQADKLNPAGRPTIEWTADGYLHDPYRITLPADLPPGEYALLAGLYTCETRPPGDCGNGDRLPVTGPDGAPLGDAIPLATITVR